MFDKLNFIYSRHVSDKSFVYIILIFIYLPHLLLDIKNTFCLKWTPGRTKPQIEKKITKWNKGFKRNIKYKKEGLWSYQKWENCEVIRRKRGINSLKKEENVERRSKRWIKELQEKNTKFYIYDSNILWKTTFNPATLKLLVTNYTLEKN